MRILCYSDHDEVSTSTARLAVEWAASTGDSVILAHRQPDGGRERRIPVGVKRRKGMPAAHALPAGPVCETEPDTACGRTMELEPNPTAADLAAGASRSSTRLILVDAPLPIRGFGRSVARFAESVAESAPVPTLVVRDAESLRQWLKAERTLRVFCAYEFSAISNGALEVVKELQGIAACSVTVGHVGRIGEEKLRLGIRSPMDFDGGDPEVKRILERDLRGRVDEVMGGDACVEIDVSGAIGRPDFEIIARAKQARADLLVIGTRQRHGLQRVLQPSVSRSALRHAPMNVLVVPRTAAPGRRPVRRPKRILAATDFSEAGNFAVKHAYAMAHPDSIVRLVHAADPPSPPGGRFVQDIDDRAAEVRHVEIVRSCERRLGSLVQEDAAARGIITETSVILHRDPATAIVEEAERFGADMICVGTHTRTGLSAALSRPVAQKILARSKRPLLIVHPPVP